jgi:hypothetical protein
MTFPSGQQISTANVSSSTGDPSLARADIYDLMVAFNQLVASENSQQGVLVLDSSGKIAGTFLPATYSTTSGQLQLQAANGVVNIQRVLRLHQFNADDLGSALGTTSPTAGDLIFLTNGDAGQPCLGCYDGTAWRIVRFMAQVGSAGADLVSTATLTASPD